MTINLACAQDSAGASGNVSGKQTVAYASLWRTENTLPAHVAFRLWTDRYTAAQSATVKAGLLSAGVALAKDRRASLADLIKSNPAKALALAAPVTLRNELPAEILDQMEVRVSGIGDFSVLGAIRAQNGPAVEPIQQFVHLNGKTYRASVYGRRLGQATKFGIPLHGIVLNGVMALDESAMRALEPNETPDSASPVVDLRDTASKAVNLSPVLGEMGGKVYRFTSIQQRDQFENKLEVAEAGIGPYPAATATNLMIGSGLAASSNSTNQENPPSAWTTGGKNVLIIRVDFSDLPGAPYSAAYIQSVADSQISPYYRASSYRMTTMTNTVTASVYRLPQTANYYATTGNNDALHADAETAASADYTLAKYDRIIVVFASLGNLAGSQITYGGLANISGPNVWCNGEFDFRVIAHELGHTFGLYHGNLWQVSDGNPISPGGTETEYGDDFDTMGANYANSHGTDFNPWFKNYLGWIADTQLVTVTTSGTYRVYAFDHDNYLAATGETLGLKIVKDGTHSYWISCRRDFTTNASLTNGVYIFWGYNYNRQSDLLDMTTPGSSDQDAGLPVGAIFTDTAIALSIHPLATGGVAPNEYRDVQIIFGALPPLAPLISSEPASQSSMLGAAAVFPVRASGNPAPVYAWERKASGSSTWNFLPEGGDYAGTSSSNLTVNVSDVAMNGDQFKCLVSNSAGSITSSPPATLTVNSGYVIGTLAGQAGISGSAGGNGTNAQFFYPYDVATDRGGNIYVADYYFGLVRKITPAGLVSTFAGTSGEFYGPEGVAVDLASNVYVADTADEQIKKITPAGVVSVLAGSYGVKGTNDGVNTGALFNNPWGIAVDANTNVYVADSDSGTIRKLTPSGANWVVTTIAGQAGNPGSSDGTSGSAQFNHPASLAVDTAGNLYVADSGNNTIRKITPDNTGTNWVVTTLAGRAGVSGPDNGLGTNALFYSPSGIAVDGAGNLFVADTYNALIRKITPQGMVSTLAGQYFVTAAADGYYTNVHFNFPFGVAVDNAANIYVADTFNYTIRVGHLASVTVPRLALTLTNQIPTLSWPVPINNFHLESSPSLSVPSWTPAVVLPAVLNGRNYATNPPSTGPLFFRLKNP